MIKLKINKYKNQGWYQNGEFHRIDGPACIWLDEWKSWYHNGKRHRDDGPAVIHANGDQEWYQNGRYW